MLTVNIPRAAGLAIEVVNRVKDGTLSFPHLVKPYWNDLLITRVELSDPSKEWHSGDGYRNGNWVFERVAQVYGNCNGRRDVHLATIDMKASTCKYEDSTISDSGDWDPINMRYLGMKSTGENQWQEDWISVHNLRREPLL